MARKCISILALAAFLLGAGGVSSGWSYIIYQAPSDTKVNVFNYGWRGLLLGGLTGLAAGYVRYSSENNNDNILRSIAYGTLIGTGAGLVAGFADEPGGQKGMGDIILTDMTRGGWFGAAVGTLYGGILAISDGDWKRVGNGAGWGYLSGVLLGLGIALYEGPKAIREGRTGGATGSTLLPGISFFRDSTDSLCPKMNVAWSFQ